MSLPLMRKTFIEALACRGTSRRKAFGLFRLCGRLSLRRATHIRHQDSGNQSLPLMRKTFIEVIATIVLQAIEVSLFRLCGRLSLRPGSSIWPRGGCDESLPLMRKTFIEVGNIPACTANSVVSSIVMEAFIEGRGSANLSPALVFSCLYSRLSFLMK